jgi:DNA repair exonuclease SbcCD ATPase subunit
MLSASLSKLKKQELVRVASFSYLDEVKLKTYMEMWGHYAESSRGFCVEYNFNSIWERALNDIEIRKIDKDIFNIEQEEEKIQSYKNEIISLESKIDELSNRVVETQKEQNELEINIEKINNNTKKINLNELNIFENLILSLKNKIDKIQELIVDFKQNQLEVKKLKEDEKIYSDLYNIFSKELMLIVLTDFLPSLEDIINNLLVQVV